MKLTRTHALALFLCAAAAPAPLRAQSAPSKLPPMPTAAEQPFIAKLQQDIPARFSDRRRRDARRLLSVHR